MRIGAGRFVDYHYLSCLLDEVGELSETRLIGEGVALPSVVGHQLLFTDVYPDTVQKNLCLPGSGGEFEWAAFPGQGRPGRK